MKYTDALTPVHRTYPINQSIELYAGALEIDVNDIEIRGKGRINFDWLPRPSIRFSLNSDDPNHSFCEIGLAKLLLPDGSTETEIYIDRINTNEVSNSLSGLVIGKGISIGTDEELKFVIFHIINFHNCIIGTQHVVHKEQFKRTCDRHILKAQGWVLTLDHPITIKEQLEQLDIQGGYSITHVAKLECANEQTFTGSEAIAFLDLCSSFFSFARGFRISTLFLVGYNIKQKEVWRFWENRKCNSWDSPSSWLPLHKGEPLLEVFPGFVNLWNEWKDVADIVLNGYLESNANSRCTEHSIILIQATLETLAWTYFVKVKKNLSATKYNNMKAEDVIRRLLTEFNIPTGIPPNCYDFNSPHNQRSESLLIPRLAQLSKKSQFDDGPQALTSVRNGVVHPRKLESILEIDSVVRSEIRSLGLWYLELSLLALMDYQGCYKNRLITSKHEGSYDLVPWNNQQLLSDAGLFPVHQG